MCNPLHIASDGGPCCAGVKQIQGEPSDDGWPRFTGQALADGQQRAQRGVRAHPSSLCTPACPRALQAPSACGSFAPSRCQASPLRASLAGNQVGGCPPPPCFAWGSPLRRRRLGSRPAGPNQRPSRARPLPLFACLLCDYRPCPVVKSKKGNMLQAAFLLGQLFEFLTGPLKLYYFSDRKNHIFLFS